MKRDDLRRRRNLKKEPLTLSQDPSPEWMKKYGYGLKYHRTYVEDLTDSEVRDRYWMKDHHCHIQRENGQLLYVSFRDRKIVKMPDPDVFCASR